MGRHRSDPRGLGRYLLLGVVAVVALVLVVVGILALRGALSTKKPVHSPSPKSARSIQPRTVPQTSAVPALLIKITHEPCRVFVKNSANNEVLQTDRNSVPLGTTLRFIQVPLQVQINDPQCADVFIHGREQPPPTPGQPWIFMINN